MKSLIFQKQNVTRDGETLRSRKRQNRGRVFATFMKRTEKRWRTLKNVVLGETLYVAFFWLTHLRRGCIIIIITPVTGPAFLARVNWAKPRTFEQFGRLVTQTLNPFKPSIAIWCQSESYMVSSFSFFFVILVQKIKEKKRSKETVTLSKTCCITNLSICIWIMNTLKNASSTLLFILDHLNFSC